MRDECNTGNILNMYFESIFTQTYLHDEYNALIYTKIICKLYKDNLTHVFGKCQFYVYFIYLHMTSSLKFTNFRAKIKYCSKSSSFAKFQCNITNTEKMLSGHIDPFPPLYGIFYPNCVKHDSIQLYFLVPYFSFLSCMWIYLLCVLNAISPLLKLHFPLTVEENLSAIFQAFVVL